MLRFILLAACAAAPCWAADDSLARTPTAEVDETFSASPNSLPLKIFELSLPNAPTLARSFVGPQLLSLILPGFDQWYEGQYMPAFFYTGVALASFKMATTIIENSTLSSAELTLDSENNTIRSVQLALQTYQAMGGFSAYASFRSAVKSQQENGRFMFLKHEETVGDVMLAPFNFAYALKPTTYVPLLLAGALAVGIGRGNSGSLSASDAFFAFSFSFNAGTHEEAVFRGWLMPVGMHYMDNLFWSNTVQASLFAAAHITEEYRLPLIQFALGWYLGYLTQRDEWTIGQSIFIHTWYDILIFSGYYFQNKTRVSRGLPAKNIFLPLPPLSLVF